MIAVMHVNGRFYRSQQHDIIIRLTPLGEFPFCDHLAVEVDGEIVFEGQGSFYSVWGRRYPEVQHYFVRLSDGALKTFCLHAEKEVER